METVHAPVPEHAPLQPANVCPVLGVAVKVTLVPLVYVSEQSLPQAIPVPVIVPLPETPVVRVYVVGVGVELPPPPPPPPPPLVVVAPKVAVTLRFRDIVTVQGAVPLQAPLHALRRYPGAGRAVRVILLLLGTVMTHGDSEQVCPCEVVMVPRPRRVSVRVRVEVVESVVGDESSVVLNVVVLVVLT